MTYSVTTNDQILTDDQRARHEALQKAKAILGATAHSNALIDVAEWIINGQRKRWVEQPTRFDDDDS